MLVNRKEPKCDLNKKNQIYVTFVVDSAWSLFLSMRREAIENVTKHLLVCSLAYLFLDKCAFFKYLKPTCLPVFLIVEWPVDNNLFND